MQRGTIVKHGRHWLLRYWEFQIRDGVRVRVNAHKRLAPIGPAFPDKKSVEPLAYEHLRPLNTRLQMPESSTPICQFIEEIYLPMVKQFLRPATYKNYRRDEWERHFKKRVGNLRLRDFRPAHGQRLLSAIAKDNPDMGHKTLLRLKSFLSGVFKHALQEGYLDGDENPMRNVSLPRTVRRAKFKGDTYTLPEIIAVLTRAGDDTYDGRAARAALAIAAFAGLRHAEIRGLHWGDYDGERLTVRRSIWRTTQSLPKTESSENTVPVLPVLKIMLDTYRMHLRTNVEEDGYGKVLKPTDWMFAGRKRGAPIVLANLVRRVITPNLTRCAVCGASKRFHDKVDHDFVLDESIPPFKGWHAFRRSLASNLYGLGVKPKVIQSILRHSDISTTLDFYVETPESESREALDKLTALMG